MELNSLLIDSFELRRDVTWYATSQSTIEHQVQYYVIG